LIHQGLEATVLHNLAVRHNGDRVAPHHGIELMSNEENSLILGGFPQHIGDLHLGFAVEGTGGLVDEVQTRFSQ